MFPVPQTEAGLSATGYFKVYELCPFCVTTGLLASKYGIFSTPASQAKSFSDPAIWEVALPENVGYVGRG
jgi:hypothetical protein